MFMRMIGQAVGAALLGAMLNWGVNRRLPGAGDAVNKLLHPLLRHTMAPADVARLGDAFAAAVHAAYLVVVVIALATLFLTLAFPRRLSPTRQ
jgi:hypothetical protein